MNSVMAAGKVKTDQITALVVEDSRPARELITKYLHQFGCNVLVACDGNEATNLIRNYKPDIITLDVVLPGRSGFELCRELKEAAATKNIPVIMCSRKGTDIDRFWGLRQGANAYLTKPFSQEEFIQTVKHCLDETRMEAE